MASPLQIILNDNDYAGARDAGGGGPKKDFFAERDEEFAAHKAKLIGQLGAIESAVAAQRQGDVGYIKVILRMRCERGHQGRRVSFVAWDLVQKLVASVPPENRCGEGRK